MSTSRNYSIHAELAMASYGNFSGETIRTIELTEKNVGTSTSQAESFVQSWKVSAQYTDPLSGVSATVFESADETKCLAVRGTELEEKDLLADGILVSPILAMFTPQFSRLEFKLNAWLKDPDILQGQNFTVTGHSLGGYLAAAVKQSFPQVTEAYIFNAPGVWGLLGNLADVLSNDVDLNAIDQSKIWNLRGSEGLSMIAGLGNQHGTSVTIHTEAAFNNHSIVLLTAIFQQDDHSFLFKIFLSSF